MKNIIYVQKKYRNYRKRIKIYEKIYENISKIQKNIEKYAKKYRKIEEKYRSQRGPAGALWGSVRAKYTKIKKNTTIQKRYKKK